MKINTHQSGFSLLEILISVVIVSLGLLGVVRMQVSNIKYINDSKLRSQAVQLANDMLDRMRANVDQVSTGKYNVAYSASLASTTNCTNTTANCDPSTMATYDLTTWLCQIGAYNSNSKCTTLGIQGPLPSGEGHISYDTTSRTTTVSVRWKDQADKTSFADVTVSVRL